MTTGVCAWASAGPGFVDDSGEKTRSTMDVADWVLHNFSKR